MTPEPKKYYRLVYKVPAGGRFYWEVLASSPEQAAKAFKQSNPPSWVIVETHIAAETPGQMIPSRVD